MKAEEFLNESYTCYHAVEKGAKYLADAGFADIDREKTKSATGYYRVIGGSLFAARPGSDNLQLVLSHTDSPGLRIRNAESGGETLDVEKYGGGLLRTYLDRQMKIAGRAVFDCGGVIKAKTVCSDFNVVIPSVAVHLGGGAEGETLTVSRDLRPLYGGGDLYKRLGVPDAVSGDLFCVPAAEAFNCGAEGEYVCSPRIDNLVSVYASLRAIAECKNISTCVAACFNSEETGSETRDGAQANMLLAFIADVLKASGKKGDAGYMLSRAFALSCDGAHAVHPNHREKYSENAPTLGGGIVIKRNDRYATDALTEAVAVKVFSEAGLKTQVYVHHPDMRCGSTIGLMAARNFGCAVCDTGVAQLSMHSAAETAAKADIGDLCAGLTAFFGREVTVCGNEIKVK